MLFTYADAACGSAKMSWALTVVLPEAFMCLLSFLLSWAQLEVLKEIVRWKENVPKIYWTDTSVVIPKNFELLYKFLIFVWCYFCLQ